MTLAAIVLLWPVGAAQARDTLAPPGSSDHWLPREDWVKRHWLPFDEYALRAELGLRGRDLEAYLFDDRRTLAALATVKGIALEPLLDRLMAPMRARSSPEHYAFMRERARRVLTQGHLAQHQFFHDYHYLAVRENARMLFGLAPRTGTNGSPAARRCRSREAKDARARSSRRASTRCSHRTPPTAR